MDGARDIGVAEVLKLLSGYVLRHTHTGGQEELEGLPLVDALSPPGAPTIEWGKMELEDLADYIADGLSTSEHSAADDAFEAAALGLAAVATYGRRDANGLCGLSRKHYEQLSVFHSRYQRTLSTPVVPDETATPKKSHKGE